MSQPTSTPQLTYIMPSTSNIMRTDPIVHSWRSIIENAATDVWGIQQLHEYQFKIIELLVSGPTAVSRRALLCVKTGGGKSAVVQMVATLLKGIHIILVPLLALGADQVEKAKNAKHPFTKFIKSVHLDELKHPGKIEALKHFLQHMTADHTLIIVASPQSLLTKHPWNKLLLHCALHRNLLNGFYIDEYHLFSSFGLSFRHEFEDVGKQFISKIFRPHPVPMGYKYPSYLVMSASMNNRVIQEGYSLTKIAIRRSEYFWSVPIDFSRREVCVMLDIIQSKQTSRVVFASILKILKQNSKCKVILYTNSKL
jgi:hypothetical protein